MENADLKNERSQRKRAERRRSIAVAMVVGAALLCLTMGVFAVASQSRDVAAESSRVHALDQMLQSATVARAQLGFGLVLNDLNQVSTIDATDAVRSANADATASVESLLTTRELINADLGGLQPETSDAVDRFVAFAADIQASDGALDDQVEALGAFEAAYIATQDGLTLERDAAIDGVRSADNTLGRLGTLVTFLLAFVIPTVAVAIHHLLTRPHRAQIEAEARAVKATILSRLRTTLVQRRLQALTEAVDALPQHETVGATPSEQLRSIERILATLDQSGRATFGHVELSSALEEAGNRANRRGIAPRVRVAASGDLVIWSDRDVLDLLIDSLLADCRARQASTAGLTADVVDGQAVIRLTHDGELRTPVELQVVANQATVNDRLALLGGDDTDLVAALHLAEDLQSELTIEVSGGRQVFRLSMPAVTVDQVAPVELARS